MDEHIERLRRELSKNQADRRTLDALITALRSAGQSDNQLETYRITMLRELKEHHQANILVLDPIYARLSEEVDQARLRCVSGTHDHDAEHFNARLPYNLYFDLVYAPSESPLLEFEISVSGADFPAFGFRQTLHMCEIAIRSSELVSHTLNLTPRDFSDAGLPTLQWTAEYDEGLSRKYHQLANYFIEHLKEPEDLPTEDH